MTQALLWAALFAALATPESKTKLILLWFVTALLAAQGSGA